MKSKGVNWSALCLWLEVAACTPPLADFAEDPYRPPRQRDDMGDGDLAKDKPWIQPILLVHGFGSSAAAWGELDLLLAEDGHLVTVPELPTYSSIHNRAEALGDEIDIALAEAAALGFHAERVNIIAHSMGGLDARYAISSLGYSNRVATLVTIATPHRGTPVADAVLGTSDAFKTFSITEKASSSVLSYLGYPDINDRSTRQALYDLTTGQARRFNSANPDSEEVIYESWAGLSNPFGRPRNSDRVACKSQHDRLPPVRHKLPSKLIASAFVAGDWFAYEASDGVVPVDSAHWTGFGGCLLGDHLALIDTDTASRTFAPNAFYLAVANRISHVS